MDYQPRHFLKRQRPNAVPLRTVIIVLVQTAMISAHSPVWVFAAVEREMVGSIQSAMPTGTAIPTTGTAFDDKPERFSRQETLRASSKPFELGVVISAFHGRRLNDTCLACGWQRRVSTMRNGETKLQGRLKHYHELSCLAELAVHRVPKL